MSPEQAVHIVAVSVHWTNHVPDAPEHWQWVTVPSFDDEEESLGHGQWTVLLDFEVSPALQGNPSRATARFLMPAAPQVRLRPGAVFRTSEKFGPPAVVTVDESVPSAS